MDNYLGIEREYIETTNLKKLEKAARLYLVSPSFLTIVLLETTYDVKGYQVKAKARKIKNGKPSIVKKIFLLYPYPEGVVNGGRRMGKTAEQNLLTELEKVKPGIAVKRITEFNQVKGFNNIVVFMPPLKESRKKGVFPEAGNTYLNRTIFNYWELQKITKVLNL